MAGILGTSWQDNHRNGRDRHERNQFVSRDQHLSVRVGTRPDPAPCTLVEERIRVAQRREKIPQDAGIKLTRWT